MSISNYKKEFHPGCLRKVDQMGVPVTLSYRQEPTYTTTLGGCCSILAMIVVGQYLVTSINSWLYQ